MVREELDKLFANESLLDKSSKDKLISLPKSIRIDDELIDGVFIGVDGRYYYTITNCLNEDICSRDITLMPKDVVRQFVSQFS